MVKLRRLTFPAEFLYRLEILGVGIFNGTKWQNLWLYETEI